jgi:hypothetical protein
MKIVRITFSAGGSNFYFDRQYEDTKTHAENCDAALVHLTETIEQHKAMAVMLMKDDIRSEDIYQDAKPAVVNFSNVALVTIENAAVYEAGPVQESEKDVD